MLQMRQKFCLICNICLKNWIDWLSILLQFFIGPDLPGRPGDEDLFELIFIVEHIAAHKDIAAPVRLGGGRKQPFTLRGLWIMKPGLREEVIPLISPRWTGQGCAPAQFFYRRSTKRRPLFAFWRRGRWRRFADKALALISVGTPPIIEKATNGDPGLLSLINFPDCISNGMSKVGKCIFHGVSSFLVILFIIPQIKSGVRR